MGQLMKMEEFLASAYKGVGKLLGIRHQQVKKPKGQEFFRINPWFAFELGGLYLSGPKAAEVVTLHEKTDLVPRHLNASDEPVIHLPNFRLGTQCNLSYTDIQKETKVDNYMSTVSMLLPMTVLSLLINPAAALSGTKIVPVYVTQPNVNNRNVKVTDLYDKTMVGKPNRTADQYGTMETAWGVGPHNMDAQKITIMFYSVHPSNSSSDPGRITSVLSSIGAGTGLAGDPVAKKITFDEAACFFRCVTNDEVTNRFPTENFGSAENQTEENAVRIVLVSLEYIQLKFRSLRNDADRRGFYQYLRDIFIKEYKVYNLDKAETNYSTAIWETEWDFDTANELNKRIWLMVVSLTPIRGGILDGLRRTTSGTYSLLQTLPESSLSDLASRLNAESSAGFLTKEKPSYDILTKLITVDVVMAVSNKKGEDNGFSREEMLLYRQHSDYIQRTLVSARKRTFRDAISTIANDLASDQVLNNTVCVLGEILHREEKPPDVNETKDSDAEKNSPQIATVIDHVIERLCSESARSVELLTVQALTDLKDVTDDMSKSDKINKLLALNKSTLASDNVKGIFTRNSLIKVRQDLNFIAYLIANFVTDTESANSLSRIANDNIGNRQKKLFDTGISFAKNEDGKIIGKIGSDGVTYGVSGCENALPLTQNRTLKRCQFALPVTQNST